MDGTSKYLQELMGDHQTWVNIDRDELCAYLDIAEAEGQQTAAYRIRNLIVYRDLVFLDHPISASMSDAEALQPEPPRSALRDALRALLGLEK